MNTRSMQATATADVTPPARWAALERPLLIGAAFVVVYVLIAWITRFYLVRPFAITPWNPASGVALAFLLVFGLRYWPALALASIANTLLLRGIPAAPYTQLLAPLTLTVGYVAMAAVLRGPLRFHIAFDNLREVIKLAAVATAGTLLIALAYVAVFRAVGSMTEQDYNYIFLRFWIGHLIGIVINTPLLLLLLSIRTQRLNQADSAAKWEMAAQAACVVLALWIIFGPRWVDPYKFFYVLFLPVIWIATRHGISGAILGVAAIQLGLIVALVSADYQAGTAVTEFQFMMLALALAGLFLGMVVTERRRTREALDRSESRMRAIVSAAPDSIVTVDRDGTIIAANPASIHVFGHDENTLTGLRIGEILPGFEAIACDGDSGITEGVRRDGTRFPAECSIGRTGGGAADLRIAVIRNISRRVESARLVARQQEELARASRLAAAGEMAAALAHELHQPLSAIRNYARAAQMQPAGSAGHALPGKIEAEAARAATVVQRLRDFFRGGISRLETFAVGAFVDAALAPMREDAARHGVTLETRVECAHLMLLIDGVQVETVVHSLVHNAIEALADTPGRRLITVSAQAQQDGFIRVSIADTGPGIAAAMAERMFEPFATTKASGTGMGLAISRSMIEAHGGRIWFDAPAGGGTVFHFTLPSTALNEAAA